jgi:hypothetical protein
MNILFYSNTKKLGNIIQNQVEKNKMVYGGKLFDTEKDFIEHLYQLAQVISNAYVEMDIQENRISITV